MKQILLIAAMAGSIVVSSAQTLTLPSSTNSAPLIPSGNLEVVSNISKGEEATQALAWSNVDQTQLINSAINYWPFPGSNGDVFQYDAQTNTLLIARTEALITNNRFSGLRLGLIKSTNNGASWALEVVLETNSFYMGMPTFAYNPKPGSSNTAEYDYVFAGLKYDITSSGGISPTEATTIIKNGTNPATPFEIVDAPAAGYGFRFGDLTADNANGIVHFSSQLDPNDGPTGGQYGAYGRFTIKPEAQDYVEFPSIQVLGLLISFVRPQKG